jgi:hypothetical protein
LTLGEIIRQHGGEYERWRGARLSQRERLVLRALGSCRTAALGGQTYLCEQCGATHYVYHSCGDRHCPQCQAGTRATWLAARQSELLPVLYFHVVFTLPELLRALVRANPRELLGLLFRAAAETLLEVAADPEHLGARIGFLAVLHTWGQQLPYHPHLHCLVPGGGLSPDGTRWIGVPGRRRKFFLPVKVLSRVFQGKFLAGLKALHAQGVLRWPAGQAYLAHAPRFQAWLRGLYRKEWVVYAKRPFRGPTADRAQVPGPLHAPRGDLQFAAGLAA